MRSLQQAFEHVSHMRAELVQIKSATGEVGIGFREYRDRIREAADVLGMTEKQAEQAVGPLSKYFQTAEIFDRGGLLQTANAFDRIYGIQPQASAEMMRKLYQDLGIEATNVGFTMTRLSGMLGEGSHDVARYMENVLNLATANRQLGVSFGEAAVLWEYFQHRVEAGKVTAQFAQEMTSTLARVGLQGDIGVQAMLGQFIGRGAGRGALGTAESVMYFRELPMFERLMGIREFVGAQTRGAGGPAERQLMAEQIYAMVGLGDWTKVAEFEKMSVDEIREMATKAEIEEELARNQLSRQEEEYAGTREARRSTLEHQIRLEVHMAELRNTMSPWRKFGEVMTRTWEDLVSMNPTRNEKRALMMGGPIGAIGVGLSRTWRTRGGGAGETGFYEQGEAIERDVNDRLRELAMSSAGAAVLKRGGVKIEDLTLDINISTEGELKTARDMQAILVEYMGNPEMYSRLVEFMRQYHRELEYAH
jgi:hypothetical protein